jgi:hypothetical protein
MDRPVFGGDPVAGGRNHRLYYRIRFCTVRLAIVKTS